MPKAAHYGGKELIIGDKKLFVGLFKWPVQDDPESYFAALLLNLGGDNWTTLVQLPPMEIGIPPTKGAMATMSDILEQFNVKVLEATSTIPAGELTWIERLKKLFDNVTVVDGKIFSGPL